VTNGAALKKAGINPIAVADTISELFSHMVFWTGLVHCDPHVRSGPPQPLALPGALACMQWLGKSLCGLT
jgi:hypothetical protein